VSRVAKTVQLKRYNERIYDSTISLLVTADMNVSAINNNNNNSYIF